MVGEVNFCRDPPDRPPSAGGVKRVCKHRKRLITKGFIAAEWPRRAVPHVCVGGVAAFRGWMAVVYFVLRSPKRQLGGLAERLRRVSSINSASITQAFLVLPPNKQFVRHSGMKPFRNCLLSQATLHACTVIFAFHGKISPAWRCASPPHFKIVKRSFTYAIIWIACRRGVIELRREPVNFELDNAEPEIPTAHRFP